MASRKSKLLYGFLYRVLPPIWSLGIRLLTRTYRVAFLDPEKARAAEERSRSGPAVFAVWHQRLFYFARFMLGKPAAVMVSLSPDGEIIGRTLARLGYGIVRGSSSNRAAGALLELTEVVRGGRVACFMADGPRGPARVSKLGPVATARDSGAGAVWPTSYAAWPVVRFGSWDRFQIPLPFARVVVAYGDPVPVPADGDREALEGSRAALETSLNALTEAADRALEEGSWRRR